MKIIATIGVAISLLLGTSLRLGAAEFSERAVAFRFNPTFNLTILHVLMPGKSQEWRVSGFAPGEGSFSQAVDAKAIRINFLGGAASVKARVQTSQGTTILIDVEWVAARGLGKPSKAILGPAQALELMSKPARAGGSIGKFYFINASGEISQRKVVP